MTLQAESAGFRRAIHIEWTGPGVVRTEVEDNFHHFAVTLDHNGHSVTAIAAEAIRHPWSLCPAAAAGLQGLVGTPLTPSLAEALQRLPIREHCTHLYDLACLAVVHAAKKTGRRRYDMAIADRIDDETRATLAIDGAPCLEWEIVGPDIIVAPYRTSLKGGFAAWATTTLDPESAESAILLRRAVFVSGGRRRDLDKAKTAADGARNMGGCFVMRPGVAERATRMLGATRDFALTGERPLNVL